MGKVNSKLLLKTSKKFDNQPYSSYPSSFPPSPSSPSSLSSLSSSSLSSSLSSLSSKSSSTSPISKQSSSLPSNLSSKFSRLRSKSFTNLQSFNCTPTPPIPLPFSSTFFSSSSSPSSHQKSFSSPIVLPTKNSSEECLLIPSASPILTPSSFKKKSKKSKLFSSLSTNSLEKSSSLSLSSSPSSPSSEISDMYQYVDNRKYFKTDDENQNIRYVFPLDNDEIDRLQTQHFIQKHVWGGNFSAPIESILSNENSKILDVGCGTGVWTLDMASEFTKPKFFGVDIEPLYPTEIKPENVQFVNANVLTGLPFEDNTFDFVYMRFMLFAFTISDWERAVSELIRVTKVGGFIEIMENDIQWYNENPFCNSIRTTIVEGLKNQRNMELIISPILPKILAKSMVAAGDTNFVNNTSSSSAALRRRRRREVNYEERLVPFGGGKVGGLYKDLYSWSAKNLKKAMSEIGFKESEWNATVDICLKQLEDSKAFDKIHRFWVMKQ